METTSTSVDKIKKSNMVELTGKFMVVSIIAIFLVLFFVFFIHLYSKWFWNRQQQNTTSTRRRRRFDFSPGHQEVNNNVTSVLNGGLDPTLLKTIPVVVFSLKEFKDGLECAVCLCDVCEGEKARLLPKCNHGFHVECIDMWFKSHSTCPLCRNPVCNDHKEEEEYLATVEVANFPTNILFWGNESQVSTLGPCLEESTSSSSNSPCPPLPSSLSSSLSLVIDVPRQTNEEEEEKSPVPTRLRSLKRLLSRDRRANPSSPRIVDVEQGARD